MIGALCYVYELFMTRLAFVVLNAPYGGVYELTIMGDNLSLSYPYSQIFSLFLREKFVICVLLWRRASACSSGLQ